MSVKRYGILTAIAVIIIIISVCICIANVDFSVSEAYADVWSGSTATSYASGDGSQETPYIIATAEQLKYFADSVNAGINYSGVYFALSNDISLNSNAESTYLNWEETPPANMWTPAGYVDLETSSFYAFDGVFSGENHFIEGVYANGETDVGLFGYLTEHAVIKNLVVKFSYINSNGSAGLIACNSMGATLQNCKTLSSKIESGGTSGGIVGYAESGSISECENYANVVSSIECGGIVGHSDNTNGLDISSSINKGSISGAVSGGIIASGNVILSLCQNNGVITATSSGGGIAASIFGIVENCVNFGNVSANEMAYGLFGNGGTITVEKCLNLAKIDSNLGNVAGASNVAAEDCINVYFDRELCNEPVDADLALPTSLITGIALREAFGEIDWYFNENDGSTYKYPQLNIFYNPEYATFTANTVSLHYEAAIIDSITVRTGDTFSLPADAETGFTISWHDSDGTIDWGNELTSVVPTENVNVYKKKVLNSPTIATQPIGLASTTYDGIIRSVYVVASHDLDNETSIKYKWYYSQSQEGTFTDANILEASFNFKDCNASGYYYCEAWFEYNGFVSEKVNTDIVAIVLNKADYATIDVPEVEQLRGTYSPTQTLVDFTLPSGFYWTDSTIIPSCNKNYNMLDGSGGYSAYYNTDSVNYENYSVTVLLYLSKADYSEITHDGLTGTYSPDNTLADFTLSDNFYWENAETKPTVPIKSYAAYYNADSTNYNDFALTIGLNLAKATFRNITHTELSGAYDPNKTLANYLLYNDYYHWSTPTTVPTIAVTLYSAYYNSDPDNYENYSLNITINVSTARPTVNVSYDETQRVFVGGSLPIISIQSSSVSGSIAWDAYTLTVGTHDFSWTFTPDDDENYESVSRTEEIEVLTVELESLTIVTPPSQLLYFALSEVIASGMTVKVVYNDGTEKSVTTYVISYDNGDNFVYGDIDFTVSYTENLKVVSAKQVVTVNRISLDVPTISDVYEYNGAEQTADIDESPDYTVTDNKQTFAGSYFVNVDLNDKNNYCWTDGGTSLKTIAWIINRKAITKPTLNGEYSFTGTKQYADIAANGAYAIEGNTATYAGDYDITVELADKDNYCWDDDTDADLTIEWTISPIFIDIPIYTESNFEYDGTMHTINITATSTAYELTDVAYVDAGSYTAIVVLLDKANYRWSDGSTANKTYPWQIAKKKLIVPTVVGTYTFNGRMQTAQIVSNAGYSVSGNTAINAGNHIAIVTITDNDNYEWSVGGDFSKNLSWKIEKLKITKPTLTGTYVYDGMSQTVRISQSNYYMVDESKIVFTNAGNYFVDVVLTDKNNCLWQDDTILDVRLTWSVAKKQLNKPTISTPKMYTYDGQNISADFGIDLTIFTVSENIAKNVGDYSAAVNIKDGNNYEWSTGGNEAVPLAYKIIEAFVSKPSLTRNGVYSGQLQSANIVENAKYTLTGNKATIVGTYTATVALNDKNNYSWNDSTKNDFTIVWSIEKFKVNKPENGESLIYNGLMQVANIEKSDKYTIAGNTGKDGGTYTARISLNDKTNNSWVDDTTDDLEYIWQMHYVKVKDENGEETVLSYAQGSMLSIPNKDGYDFVGWYLSADFSGDAVTSLDNISQDVILYAKWTEKSVPVILEDEKKDGGLSKTAIIGISVGGILVMLALLLIIYSFIKKR